MSTKTTTARAYSYTKVQGGYDIHRDGSWVGWSAGNLQDAKATAADIDRRAALSERRTPPFTDLICACGVNAHEGDGELTDCCDTIQPSCWVNNHYDSNGDLLVTQCMAGFGCNTT